LEHYHTALIPGRNEAETLENIKEAIREYLDVREDLLTGAEVREVEVA
jgi:hypothetical protein